MSNNDNKKFWQGVGWATFFITAFMYGSFDIEPFGFHDIVLGGIFLLALIKSS